MPKGIPLTDDYLLEKRLTIAHAAAELIFKQGYNETSISQIARKLGIGKSTIYDYFSSKDEIILLLLDKPLGEVRDRAKEIEAGEGTAAEKLTRILEMHLDVLLRDKAFIFKLFFESQCLPLEVQARHETKRQAYQDILIRLVEGGIREESFRPVDPGIAVKILLSILSSVILTARPHGTPGEMLNEGLDLIYKGMEAVK